MTGPVSTTARAKRPKACWYRFCRPTPAAREQLGEALAAKGYTPYRKQAGPETGFGFAIGDDLEFGEGESRFGWIGGVRYSQTWDSREEDRKVFGLSQGCAGAYPRLRAREERTPPSTAAPSSRPV